MKKLTNISRADILLVAATVVAALRMMLIHAVFIGFDLEQWEWFKAVEVGSGLAFAVLEGVALAYVSRLWVGLRPTRTTEWVYWGVLALGQVVLLGSIIGVTAYAAASVRRDTGVDALLGNNAAVIWSMFVTALNPLMVVLIGIARAIDPAEQQPETEQAVWPPVETQVNLFLDQVGDQMTPDRMVREFKELTGITLTIRNCENWLTQHRLARLSAPLDQGQPGDMGQAVAGELAAPADEPTGDPVTHSTGSGQAQSEQVRPTAADIAARRRRVRMLKDKGKSQAQIAAELGIGLSTVKRDLAEAEREGVIVRGNGKMR